MTFEEIYHSFTKTQEWQAMLNTQENSPYHMEKNVAEHTRMALAFYKNNFYSNRNENERLLSQLAILFHDVGKPSCEVEKFTEKRGLHNSYAGHELMSSRMFEDYALSNNICLTDLQIRQVKWMIENHLPYGRKSYDDFRIDATRALTGNLQIFSDVLMSDAAGRITNDSKIPKVQEFIKKELYLQTPYKRSTELTAYILVGPSGSGKSTVSEELMKNSNTVIFSLDTCRIDYYLDCGNKKDENVSTEDFYSIAWDFCNNHNANFKEYAKKVFCELIKNKHNIIVDNTNLSPKVRRQWITLLKQHNYYIIGFEFMSSLDLLKQRAKTRLDKIFSYSIINQQYVAQQLLRFSEVDSIRIINNMRK